MGSIPITRSIDWFVVADLVLIERKLEFGLSRSAASVRAHVAQSVEHVLGKDEVTGSIPVVGSSCRKNLRRR